MGSAASVFRVIESPALNSVTVPKLSVVVVLISVATLGCVATVVEDLDVCAKATEPIRAVANATLRNSLIIRTNFLVYEVAAVIAAKGHPIRASEGVRRTREVNSYGSCLA